MTFGENGSGLLTLRGAVNGCCNSFARYQVTFNGNIAVPTGGTVQPIAVALSINGEALQTSRAIVTPAAVEDYFNVTSTAYITVPRNGNQMGGTYAARGRGSNANRDSRGRYTTGSTVDELYSLMNSTTDERVRQSLQRSINDIEGR